MNGSAKTLQATTQEPNKLIQMEKTYQITLSQLHELRKKFFKECTDNFLGIKSLPKVCLAPHDLFEWFVDNLKEVKNDVTNDKGIELYLTNRIKQLNEADAAFCDIRWQQGLPIDMNMAKRIAREESNKVTFARQELEMVLKLLNSGKGVQECDATKAK